MEDRLPILSSDIILKTNSHKYGFCSGQLRFRRAIGIFLSLCWHSPLRKTQTTVASVNQPLLYNVITTTSLQINSSQGRINFSFNFKIRRRCETDHPWLTHLDFFVKLVIIIFLFRDCQSERDEGGAETFIRSAPAQTPVEQLSDRTR